MQQDEQHVASDPDHAHQILPESLRKRKVTATHSIGY
jgi:hypothetical protein